MHGVRSTFLRNDSMPSDAENEADLQQVVCRSRACINITVVEFT